MMTSTARPMAICLAAFAFLSSGCARLDDGPGSGGIEHPMDPAAVVLRIETGGGFLPPEFGLREIPSFSVMGDGVVIVPGPQIEIYPPPALPSVQAFTVTEEGIQQLLQAARAAGLLGELPDLGTPAVADAATTTITVVAGGLRQVVRAYALSESPGDDSQLTAEQEAARRRLVEFQRKAFDLRGWLPDGSVGAEEQFPFDELRVFVFNRTLLEPPDDLPQPQKAWPLTTPLPRFGAPLGGQAGARCGTVEGSDLQRLLGEAGSSNTLTPWTSGGETYHLVLRPLMPDESGCPEELYPST